MRFKCLAVGVAILVTVGVSQLRSQQQPQPGARAVGGQNAADLVKHGEYLVTRVALCGDCHTPRDAQGKPDQTRFLQGVASLPIQPKTETKNWADLSPDITVSGLAGKWSEEQLAKFLMTGIDPQGKQARAPMPPFRLDATDTQAIYLYIKSLGAQEARRPRR